MENEEVFTLDEAAAFLKVSAVTAKQFVNMGYLRVARTSGNRGRILVLKSECIAAVKKLMDTPPPPLPKLLPSSGADTFYQAMSPEEAQKSLQATFDAVLGKRQKTSRTRSKPPRK